MSVAKMKKVAKSDLSLEWDFSLQVGVSLIPVQVLRSYISDSKRDPVFSDDYLPQEEKEIPAGQRSCDVSHFL